MTLTWMKVDMFLFMFYITDEEIIYVVCCDDDVIRRASKYSLTYYECCMDIKVNDICIGSCGE